MCFITWAANKNHAQILIRECNLWDSQEKAKEAIRCEKCKSEKKLKIVDLTTRISFNLAILLGVIFSIFVLVNNSK